MAESARSGILGGVIAVALFGTALVAQTATTTQKPVEPRLGQPGKDVIWVPTLQPVVEAMRRILVENARRKNGPVAGGRQYRVDLSDIVADGGPDLDLVALSEALDKLQATDPRAADLVKLRFFAGLTRQQAAEHLGISVATADNDLAYAKGLLKAKLSVS
jgi:hypothetical protein